MSSSPLTWRCLPFDALRPRTLYALLQLRSSVFVDAGNVYADTCYLSTTQGCGSVDLAQMAVSLGVGVTWYSPMGPLSFSLAAPLKKPDNAETQVFQFSLGQTF